jgi:spore coat polysaccharide biosynthesis protein SpsF
MKVVAILQARMNSTRLHGKSMLPLAGKPMVENIIERVQRSKRVDEVMLAFPEPDRTAFQPVLDACCANGIKRFTSMGYAGDENDLVARYYYAARLSEADLIVRVPCDNPCVEPEYIDQAVEAYLDKPFTFFSNTVAYIKNQCIDGIGAEVMSMSRLKWLEAKTSGNAQLREHPHKYFEETFPNDYDEPDYGIEFKPPYHALRFDVNTSADYEFIKDIYDHFGHNRFHVSEVLAYLERKKVTV